jgi:hypothetical protein
MRSKRVRTLFLVLERKLTETIKPEFNGLIRDLPFYDRFNRTLEYRELCGKSGMSGLQRTRILSAETMQVYAKQEAGKGGELANLQRLGEQPFMYNRFGAKNGYLISVFRVYFDIGWFAWERLGYARGHRQKRSLLRRLNAIAARPPPDLNAEPVLQQQQPSGSSLCGTQDEEDSRPVSSNLSMITMVGSEAESVLYASKPRPDSSDDRRTSGDTGVETLLDEEEVDFDSDGEPTTTIRSVSELHGSDDPSEALDSESCVVLTGGLSSLSLLANASDASIFATSSVSRHSSIRRTLHRNSSVGSNGSSASSNCSLM